MVGPSKQDHKQSMSKEIVEFENSLEKENEINQKSGESHDSFPGSVKKIPQTPLLDSSSNQMSVIMEEVMPCEEGLVEARISWDIWKTLGLKVSNEKAMICMLAKVPEFQDFVLPRKRGRASDVLMDGFSFFSFFLARY